MDQKEEEKLIARKIASLTNRQKALLEKEYFYSHAEFKEAEALEDWVYNGHMSDEEKIENQKKALRGLD